MVLAGFILSVVAIAIAVIIPFSIEWLKRPNLEISAATWPTPGPVRRTFAVARVRNKPVAKPFSRILTREVAQGCIVEIDFCHWEAGHERLFPTVRGRWSSHPQPISLVPSRAITPYAGPPTSAAPSQYAGGTVSTEFDTGASENIVPHSGGTASTSMYAGGSNPMPYIQAAARTSRMNYTPSSYDPTLDPPRQDVGVSQEGEEVAVAILRDGKAFAFGTESYAYPEFGKPDWELRRGTYYIIVRVRGANAEREQDFKLEYLDDNFANFRLQPI